MDSYGLFELVTQVIRIEQKHGDGPDQKKSPCIIKVTAI